MYTIPEHLKQYDWYAPHLAYLGYDVEAEAKRANLRGANLRWANLRGANLRWANLRWADLRWANLRWADLSGADLRGAYLSGADLSGADLRGANLRGANLRWADLRGANLRCADLRGADLSGADLSGADLSGADLSGADLSGATYNVLNVLQADWCDDVPDGLCTAMMAFDRDAHPNPDAFKAWADGGDCPLDGANVERALLFNERRELYNHSLASPPPWALWAEIAAAFGIEI